MPYVNRQAWYRRHYYATNDLVYEDNTNEIHTSTTPVLYLWVNIVAGLAANSIFRILINMRAEAGTAYFYIAKNGVQVGAEWTRNSNVFAWTAPQDLTFTTLTLGDTIEVWGYNPTAGKYAELQGFKIEGYPNEFEKG